MFDRGQMYFQVLSCTLEVLLSARAEVGGVCLIGGRQHPSDEPLPSSLPQPPLRSSAQG